MVFSKKKNCKKAESEFPKDPREADSTPLELEHKNICPFCGEPVISTGQCLNLNCSSNDVKEF